MRHQGKISNWKDEKGFGFITPNGGGGQVFVHISSFANRRRRPEGDEIVSYELKTDVKGRAQAGSVAFVGERLPSAPSSGKGKAALILVVGFLVFVAGAVFAHKLPGAVLGLYLIASIVTFIAYALDKSAARNDRWRTAENTLHFFAVVGGWPGALLAQRLLHHKSRKPSFQIVFWATVILNCGVLGWLFSSSGAAVLFSILGAQ